MQHTGLPGRDTARRTRNGNYLLGREFAFLHSGSLRLHSIAKLYEFAHFLALLAGTPILDMSSNPCERNGSLEHHLLR
jgi:hypothetical protein